jgi:FdhE protein
MTTSGNAAVLDLGRQYPEWQSWLTVVDEVLHESTEAHWDSLVTKPPQPQNGKAPLLADATVVLDTATVSRWSKRLMQIAYRSGAPKMSTLGHIRHGRLNSADLFAASLCQDNNYLRTVAAGLAVDVDAFQAVALLIALPFLQACNRHWASSVGESWLEGYCPICGAWPAYGEVRGIERNRYLRCGRCGGAWQTRCLSCAYCGMTDHEQLLSLVPEKSGSNSAIDACKRCRGYVKTFTTLRGDYPLEVIVKDLATVDLDIVALAQEYRRLEGPGYPVDVHILAKPTFSERMLSWR